MSDALSRSVDALGAQWQRAEATLCAIRVRIDFTCGDLRFDKEHIRFRGYRYENLSVPFKIAASGLLVEFLAAYEAELNRLEAEAKRLLR